MTVIGGIALFLAGFGAGAGFIGYNRACVTKAEMNGRKECDALRKEVYDVKFRSECDRAYREGYAEGRRNPLTDIERLASTFEGRNVTVRTKKGA